MRAVSAPGAASDRLLMQVLRRKRQVERRQHRQAAGRSVAAPAPAGLRQLEAVTPPPGECLPSLPSRPRPRPRPRRPTSRNWRGQRGQGRNTRADTSWRAGERPEENGTAPCPYTSVLKDSSGVGINCLARRRMFRTQCLQ